MNTTPPICQSCGMPMVKPEDFGTKTNESKHEEYCTYCYQKGEFTFPATNVEEMIEKLVAMHDRMEITEEEARKMATAYLPKLKRWRV
jgi:hypothetical protein